MANIKDLDVTMTIRVGLGDIEAPKKVIKQLKDLANKQEILVGDDITNVEALEWLNANIHSKDAYEWTYKEIEIN